MVGFIFDATKVLKIKEEVPVRENGELNAITGLSDLMVWESLQELLNGCIIDMLQEERANIFKGDGLHLIDPSRGTQDSDS
jgi:hypothetical protein